MSRIAESSGRTLQVGLIGSRVRLKKPFSHTNWVQLFKVELTTIKTRLVVEYLQNNGLLYLRISGSNALTVVSGHWLKHPSVRHNATDLISFHLQKILGNLQKY